MQLNHVQRELCIKLVYDGPGLSGKTTNLQQVHARSHAQARGQLMTLETRDDRTLFFDLFPVFFEADCGYRVKLKLFTVPGQVIHNATRRVVLQHVDAVAFIADSRRDATEQNNADWRNLDENMRENGLDPREVPRVIQFNKCDLPNARSPEEIDEARRRGGEPVIGAVAIRGEGVLETLEEALRAAWRALDARGGAMRGLGLPEEELLGQIFGRMDCTGTRLAGRYPPLVPPPTGPSPRSSW